ncbi:MAG: hypothetical protein ABSF16_01205 [Terracidiphilus sp.]|jgi:hypothetical protein
MIRNSQELQRDSISVILAGAAVACLLLAPATSHAQSEPPPPALQAPISVYNNWSSYDELSDNIPLTEKLAMRELDELLRLKRAGVRFDYYMMDAFWFAPDGAYRDWRKPNWPNGPDAWIKKCRDNGVLPGLWFSTNTLVKIQAAPAWKNSLNANGSAMSFSEGGFLPDFMSVLQHWYDRGIRMFKFDFVDLTAATPADAGTMSKAQIKERNSTAFREALLTFRQKNPDAVLLAFNGFGGTLDNTYSPLPFSDPTDLRWLEVFQMEYTGDPRPSDVPEANFWRSMDIYSDHMVRRFEQLGFPLERIDSTGFMVGNTGTIYYRRLHAWKGAFLLMMARGGWVNTVHGNLEFIDNRDALWVARAQSLFFELQGLGRIHTFGGIPGEVEPYGFGGVTTRGSVYVVVNPGQTVAGVKLPVLAPDQPSLGQGRVQFRDAGFEPQINGTQLSLGPGQMAMVGFGAYASLDFDFGIQSDVVIPRSIAPFPISFRDAGVGSIEASVQPFTHGVLRVIVQEMTPNGELRRTWAGGPPSGENMGKVFALSASQNDRTIPVRIDYDKVIWSGLNWAVGEIDAKDLTPGIPLLLRFHSAEKDPIKVKGTAYLVEY